MLAQYKICRGRRDYAVPLPTGIRQDTRWRCRKHPPHPDEALVKVNLAAPSDQAWHALRAAYWKELELRFGEDRTPFDDLAKLASENDVFIGCSCPTKTNPRVDRCHTFVALEFMRSKYPALKVELPAV